MTSQEYLERAKNIDLLIASDKRELEKLRSQAAGLSGKDFSERVQSSANNSSIDNIIDKIIELKNKINKDLKECIALKNEIFDVIKAVKNNDERIVLQLRYIEFMKWTEISVEMKYSLRGIHELHGRALKNVVIPESLH